MACKPRFHRGSDPETRMNAAEIVVSKMQSNSSFQVRQFVRKGVRKPSQAAKLHPHREVLALNKRRADVSRIRITLTHFGYNLRDSWWGVPLIPELPVISVQFGQLGKVHVGPKAFFDGLAVEDVGVGGELDALRHPLMQVTDEELSVHA